MKSHLQDNRGVQVLLGAKNSFGWNRVSLSGARVWGFSRSNLKRENTGGNSLAVRPFKSVQKHGIAGVERSRDEQNTFFADPRKKVKKEL